MPKGRLVLGYSITPLHPGVGRAPGAVDLPVQRDPMGYPLIYASSIKGALKAECGRRMCREFTDKSRLKFTDKGRLICREGEKNDDCNICCCLFGNEPEESQTSGTYPGIYSVTDFIPLFVPVPSLEHGYIYATTPYLAGRVLDILDATGIEKDKLREPLEKVAELDPPPSTVKVLGDTITGEKLTVGTVMFKAGKIGDRSAYEGLQAEPLKSLGALATKIPERLAVFSNADGPIVVEKGLVRVSRVRLRVDTKTVSERGLWTEEYVPAGTVFVGGLITVVPRRNEFCEKNRVIADVEEAEKKLEKFLEKISTKDCTVYMTIGGKETVGRGLLKLVLHPCNRGGNSGQS